LLFLLLPFLVVLFSADEMNSRLQRVCATASSKLRVSGDRMFSRSKKAISGSLNNIELLKKNILNMDFRNNFKNYGTVTRFSLEKCEEHDPFLSLSLSR
jgi:hypothetical protein